MWFTALLSLLLTTATRVRAGATDSCAFLDNAQLQVTLTGINDPVTVGLLGE
jgi:hypothetical protein